MTFSCFLYDHDGDMHRYMICPERKIMWKARMLCGPRLLPEFLGKPYEPSVAFPRWRFSEVSPDEADRIMSESVTVDRDPGDTLVLVAVVLIVGMAAFFLFS